MHAIHHAQASLHFSAFGRLLCASKTPPSNDAAHAYWLAQRFRCDQWHQAISQHREQLDSRGASRRLQSWRAIDPTLQEILVSEPLLRVVAYLTQLLEDSGLESDWGPLAHSALMNHLEARARCLNLIVFGHGLPVEQAVRLNRLRRLLESVSDVAIGMMPPSSQLAQFAFDEYQVRRAQTRFGNYSSFSRFPLFYRNSVSSGIGLQLQAELDERAAHPELNRELLSSAVSLLPLGGFDDFGLPLGPVHAASQASQDDTAVNFNDPERPISAPFHLFAVTRRDANQSVDHRRHRM